MEANLESQYVWLLSLIVFVPSLAALLIAFLPKEKPDLIKWVSLAATIVVFVLTALMAIPPSGPPAWHFQLGLAKLQDAFSLDWIPSFNIYYFMGVDGISFALLMLTSFSSVLAMAASWPITKHVKAYCILFLLLETGMLGVFLALDFFLFYVFWEVMLLPMYFLIGVWGGPRREYAAIKFFLYTLLGSVLMLIAILMLYFNSDLAELAKKSELAGGGGKPEVVWSDLHLHPSVTKEVTDAVEDRRRPAVPHVQYHGPVRRWASTPTCSTARSLLGRSLQWWAFVLLFIGFAIKVPIVPFHTWLPDAHVEAPTPISMILAGVLLKMGGYAFEIFQSGDEVLIFESEGKIKELNKDTTPKKAADKKVSARVNCCCDWKFRGMVIALMGRGESWPASHSDVDQNNSAEFVAVSAEPIRPHRSERVKSMHRQDLRKRRLSRGFRFCQVLFGSAATNWPSRRPREGNLNCRSTPLSRDDVEVCRGVPDWLVVIRDYSRRR